MYGFDSDYPEMWDTYHEEEPYEPDDFLPEDDYDDELYDEQLAQQELIDYENHYGSFYDDVEDYWLDGSYEE